MSAEKSRHGCLTAWLILMMVANSAVAVTYLLAGESIRETYPDAPDWAFPVMAGLGLINLICAIAIFLWKRWGFCGSSVVSLFVNMSIGVDAQSTVMGLVGVAMLYAVLQIGGENKGWPQLD